MIPHLFLVSSNLRWTCHQMSLAAHCFDLQSFDFCFMHAAENSRGTTTPYYTNDQHSKCFKHHSNHSALVRARHSLSLTKNRQLWTMAPPGAPGSLVAPFGNNNQSTKSGKTMVNLGIYTVELMDGTTQSILYYIGFYGRTSSIYIWSGCLIWMFFKLRLFHITTILFI